MNVFFYILLTPQRWSTCKSWSTPWGGTPKLSFFSWFFIEKGLKLRKKVINSWKKVVQPAFGCCKHPKTGWNTQQTDCIPNLSHLITTIKNKIVKFEPFIFQRIAFWKRVTSLCVQVNLVHFHLQNSNILAL